VERGTCAGKLAYRIHPANNKAKKELRSGHAVALKLNEKKEYRIMREGKEVTKI
jgi:hypothetical protein